MSAPLPNNNFTCACGSMYSTENALKQHVRRYCRGIQTSQASVCENCNRQFSSYAGLRQHQRHAHPEEYNEKLRAESANTRSLWTADEEDELAMKEAQCDISLPIKELINYLAQNSKRSKEAIRARRKQQKYIEKVAAFRHRQQPDSSMHPTEPANNISQANERLLIQIRDIPSEKLTNADVSFRDCVIHQTPDVAIANFDQWFGTLLSFSRRTARETNANSTRGNARKLLVESLRRSNIGRRKKRAILYKLAQKDYASNLKKYANNLLDGVVEPSGNEMPSADDIKTKYNEIFGTVGITDNEEIIDQRVEPAEISFPISAEEILNAIKNSKSNSPGPDGVDLKLLSRIHISRLMLLFNAMLLLETVPAPLKKSRTVLIPKSSGNLTDINNWRPITIGSIIVRIFNKIISNRLLSSIELQEAQRGFTKIDGCLANCITLQSIIKSRRKKGQPLSLIALDISKAFDSVSHHSIIRSLKRFNIDEKTVNLISQSYTQCTTNISCNGVQIGEFNVNRGVKQGDPLSPILFNMVIDELLVKLQPRSGVPVANSKICALAYADDIILSSVTPNDAELMLNFAIQFFRKRDLLLNANKCSSLILQTVPSKKKVFVETVPRFKIEDRDIPALNIREELRYVGSKFNYTGQAKGSMEDLYEQLTRIRRSPLKPQQKLTIIRTYLIPRFIAGLQLPNITSKILKKADKKIRAFIKAILHLPQHCSSTIFYAPLKSGGLGIFNFNSLLPIIMVKRLEKLRTSSTLLSNTINLAEPIMNRLKRLVPENITDTKQARLQFAKDFHKSFSGKGLGEAIDHSTSYEFIVHPPRYWNGEEFIKAIQLRFNLLPCKGIPSNPPSERRCRTQGCIKTESVSHILQQCPATHWQRISRHNFIIKRLKDASIRRGWTVTLEPHIRGRDGELKKPDIILEKADKVIVSDVGVSWEGNINLSMQYANKTARYSTPPFIEKLQQLYPEKNIYILPLILGARGTWCIKNKAIMSHLQLTKSNITEMINTTLRGGWMIHSTFMRTVWRNR